MNAHSLPSEPHRWRAPQYARAADCLRVALPAIAPIKRTAVSAWAAEKRKILDNGSVRKWRNDVVPYMVEPADMLNSRRYRGEAFAGPARTGKTAALIENKIGHTIECDPTDIRIIQMDQGAAREFSLKKLDKLIRYCPSLEARKAQGRNTDNIYDKRYLGNMTLDIGWPVISKVSSSDIPIMLLTDYDRMPEDIGDEGNLYDLAMKRTQTFGSRGMALAESSPGRLLTDEDWKPAEETPHMAPPTSGILALFNRGTRGRWYWRCPDCDKRFEPDFHLLVYPKDGTPAERGREAEMMCPHCGVMIAAKHKRDLNLGGVWLHEAADGSLVTIDDERIRETDIVSYWLKGPAAAFQSWTELVTKYETAQEEFERTGDETSLKTTVNVDQGHPHKPRSLGAGSDISVQTLKDKAEAYPLVVAPAEVRFLTVQVDVQKGRFVVHVIAWGRDLESWVIDRREIHEPPKKAPGASKRAIDPARYLEDWDVLFDLLEEIIPVSGGEYGIKPAALIVDSGGEDGVSKNAYAFYRRAKKLGHIRRVFLAKGRSTWKADRAREVAPEKILGEKVKGQTDLLIVQIGTWRLKAEIVTSLGRDEPGPDAIHLSKHLPDQVFEEFCAERQTKKGWELKQGQKRNEALDLAVYGRALVIVLGAEKFDWNAAPAWAAPIDENSFAVRLDAAKVNDPEPVAIPKPRGRRVRSRGI